MPPLRPFPFPHLSIGTDIAQRTRILNLLTIRRIFPRFVRKLLTAPEQRHFYARFGEKLRSANADDGRHWRSGALTDKVLGEAATFLAGRWAAKEAIIKACTWRSLTFDEIQVLKSLDTSRIYGVILDAPSRQTIAMKNLTPPPLLENEREGEQEAGQVVKVSISHDGEYATAVCLAAVEPGVGDVGGEAAAREVGL